VIREKVMMAYALTYIAFVAVAAFAIVVGLPVALFHGATSGDWTWLLIWAVVATVSWIADRLGLIKSVND
jgi:hypothetical protein